MNLRTEYDAWHKRFHTADPEHDDTQSPWYKLLSEYVGDPNGLRILEVACGRGGFTTALARGGAHVTGCDFSPAALQATQQKTSRLGVGVTLVQGDAQALPFASESFDAVVSCETIEHLPKVQAALREMQRVTKPGGRLFLTTPNYANFMGLYEIYAMVRHPGRKDDQPYDRRQWFPQILWWIRNAGWNISATDGTVHQFPFFPGANPKRWMGIESNRTIRKLLSPFAYTYFVMANRA